MIREQLRVIRKSFVSNIYVQQSHLIVHDSLFFVVKERWKYAYFKTMNPLPTLDTTSKQPINGKFIIIIIVIIYH